MDEWATKEELIKGTKIRESEAEETIEKLIKNDEIEADYSNPKNPRFKLTNNFKGKIPEFLDSLQSKYGDFEEIEVPVEESTVKKMQDLGELEPDGRTINEKGNRRISRTMDKMIKQEEKYYPTIRHGYLHLKHKFKEGHEYPEEVKKYSKEAGYDLDEVTTKHMLDNAELFEIDNKTKWILLMTDNELFERKTPYERFVLDCDLNIDNLWFKGFLVTSKGLTWTYFGKTDGFCEKPLMFHSFSKNLDNLEKHFIENTELKNHTNTIKKLKTFICNFIDFLNNPEVRIIRFERKQKNIERRLRQNKEILPSANKIIISGQLKVYIDKMHDSSDWEGYNYRFWVRGHFKRFWNKKRYSKLYSLLQINELPSKYYVDDNIKPNDKIIMIWNKPFIKGSGILIEHKYELKKPERKI